MDAWITAENLEILKRNMHMSADTWRLILTVDPTWMELYTDGKTEDLNP